MQVIYYDHHSNIQVRGHFSLPITIKTAPSLAVILREIPMLKTCLQRYTGYRLNGKERKSKVPCLPSVTAFSSKLVFKLAEHPTLL